MPRKREPEPLVKVTLNLFERDYQRMHELYATTGASVAIRALVRAHVQRLEAKIAQSNDTLVAEIDIELEDNL
jgi:hypothetical protein